MEIKDTEKQLRSIYQIVADNFLFQLLKFKDLNDLFYNCQLNYFILYCIFV